MGRLQRYWHPVQGRMSGDLVVACFEISRMYSWKFAVPTNIYVGKLTRHILHVLQYVLLDSAPLCVP